MLSKSGVVVIHPQAVSVRYVARFLLQHCQLDFCLAHASLTPPLSFQHIYLKVFIAINFTTANIVIELTPSVMEPPRK